MTIKEQLVKMNETFKRLHQDFCNFENQEKALDVKYSKKRNEIKEKWQKEYNRLNQLNDEILKYYRIAKDNSKKELIRTGVSPKTPDISKLNTLVEHINIYDRTDPIAGQIIDLASAYVSYVEKEKSLVSQKEKQEESNCENSKKSERNTIAQNKKRVISECERYLKGEDVKNLVLLFEMIHRDYEITDKYFTEWGKATKRKRMMLIGFSQYHVDVPQVLGCVLKSSLGTHYNENNKMVNCPCGFTTDSHEDILVEYNDLNEHLLKKGIQALLLNYIRYFKPTEYKISLIDYIHYNADVLGPLSVLSKTKNGVIEPISMDQKTLKNNISILAQYYRKVENRIGSSTVYSYNKNSRAEDRIPFRIIIINKGDDILGVNNDTDLQYIINNSERFGITTVRIIKNNDGGSKGKEKENKYNTRNKDAIRIISDDDGRFYINNDNAWQDFCWLTSLETIPSNFVDKIEKAVAPTDLGTKYFKRYKMQIPQKSPNGRKPISIPFAVGDNDKVIECNFENETFAAYIMGAAGSGKSTLLHTIISGLIMNYHPDEVELWLMDFKMLEFKRYVDCMPPHIKYILLEKSEDLVFDIIDKLTDLLDDRQFLFSQNGWSKLSDVPVEENMPAIFIIIDEFAQMSQILKETKGTGYGSDYTIKLENLLAKGRALGLKFIFASQTYTTGISGLTETACKQIQMRFAMKNTPDEIKQTLTLASDEITPEISSWISSLPAYETLFKWRNEENKVNVGRFKNLYTEGNEIESLISLINSKYRPLPAGSNTDNTSYIEKNPVTVDGGKPKSFRSQIPLFKAYEQHSDVCEIDEDDILMYAGAPCSFSPVRSFVLVNGISENILIVSGNRENKMSIVISLLNSYSRHQYPIEIWSHERNAMFKKFKDTVIKKYQSTTSLDKICSSISKIRKKIENREYFNQLIVVIGYDMLSNDMEILGSDEGAKNNVIKSEIKKEKSSLDMNAILNMLKNCSDPAEKKRLLEEYNSGVSKEKKVLNDDEGDRIYDARLDLEWIIKRAPNYGIHFVFCFDQARDFISTKLDEKSFQHKLLFSMAKDDSINISGNRKANEVDDGVCLYTNGKESFTLRPYIYKGIPCNGWIVDDNGKIVQRRGGV